MSSTDEQIFVSSTDEQIFVGDSIEMSYDPNVIMKRAESFFDKESYAEAIVEYKHFLNLHRNHIIAPYAQYKIGVSHYKQFQTVDRDPDPLNNAIVGFEKLLKEFPASRYEAEAKETILTCKQQLIQRHLMVGEFYFKREAYLAAAHRFEKIITDFPEVEYNRKGHVPAWLKHTRIWESKNGPKTWLVELIRQYPEQSSSLRICSNPFGIDSERPSSHCWLRFLTNPLPQKRSTISRHPQMPRFHMYSRQSHGCSQCGHSA